MQFRYKCTLLKVKKEIFVALYHLINSISRSTQWDGERLIFNKSREFSFLIMKSTPFALVTKKLVVYGLWKKRPTQHGNGPKSDFWSDSFFFQELSEIPHKRKSVEGFQNIFDPFTLYLHLIRFPIFFIGFCIFWGPFPVFRKSVKFKTFS